MMEKKFGAVMVRSGMTSMKYLQLTSDFQLFTRLQIKIIHIQEALGVVIHPFEYQNDRQWLLSQLSVTLLLSTTLSLL